MVRVPGPRSSTGCAPRTTRRWPPCCAPPRPGHATARRHGGARRAGGDQGVGGQGRRRASTPSRSRCWTRCWSRTPTRRRCPWPTVVALVGADVPATGSGAASDGSCASRWRGARTTSRRGARRTGGRRAVPRRARPALARAGRRGRRRRCSPTWPRRDRRMLPRSRTARRSAGPRTPRVAVPLDAGADARAAAARHGPAAAPGRRDRRAAPPGRRSRCAATVHSGRSSWTSPRCTPGSTRRPLWTRTGAGEALELLRRMETLLKLWSTEPPPVLKSGGLGVRDLRKLARELDTDERGAGLLAETGCSAPAWSPTRDGHAARSGCRPRWPTCGWSATPANQWATLAAAWLDLPRLPGLAGVRDAKDKVLAPLSDDLRRPPAPAERRRILSALAELRGGAGVADPDDLAACWPGGRRGGAGGCGTRSCAGRWPRRRRWALVALGALTAAGPGAARRRSGRRRPSAWPTRCRSRWTTCWCRPT